MSFKRMANTHMKRCSISLIRQIKSKLQWASTSDQSEWPSSESLQTINSGKGVEKREPSYTVGGNVNWYSHYGRWYGGFLKKLGIKPPYDTEIPLLGIYPEESKIEKYIRTTVFIAVLFTIARTWKQPRCPLTDEWIKKLWYLYTQWNITQPQKGMHLSQF